METSSAPASIYTMVFERLKTVVAKSVLSKGSAAAAGGSSSVVVSNASGAGGTSFMSVIQEASRIANSIFEEKEWQCPCGHKFRASGEWVATVPAMCEVPTCPNPKFYLEEKGRALLEANPNGVRLEQVDNSKALPEGDKKVSSGGCGMGGRFGGKK